MPDEFPILLKMFNKKILPKDRRHKEQVSLDNFLNKVYLLREKRLYQWFNLNKLTDIMKLIGWVIYSNLFFPSLVVGIFKSIKHNDLAGLYEPTVNLLVTDMLVIEFLKNSKGRKMLASLQNE